MAARLSRICRQMTPPWSGPTSPVPTSVSLRWWLQSIWSAKPCRWKNGRPFPGVRELVALRRDRVHAAVLAGAQLGLALEDEPAGLVEVGQEALVGRQVVQVLG